MSEPRWLISEEIRIAHERQLSRFGGPPGIRDENALESALDRLVNRWRYEAGDLPSLAAANAFRLACNHAFVDGNKWIVFVATVLFLRLNAVMFRPDPVEATHIILGLAAGEIDEAGMARWIRDNWPSP